MKRICNTQRLSLHTCLSLCVWIIFPLVDAFRFNHSWLLSIASSTWGQREQIWCWWWILTDKKVVTNWLTAGVSPCRSTAPSWMARSISSRVAMTSFCTHPCTHTHIQYTQPIFSSYRESKVGHLNWSTYLPTSWGGWGLNSPLAVNQGCSLTWGTVVRRAGSATRMVSNNERTSGENQLYRDKWKRSISQRPCIWRGLPKISLKAYLPRIGVFSVLDLTEKSWHGWLLYDGRKWIITNHHVFFCRRGRLLFRRGKCRVRRRVIQRTKKDPKCIWRQLTDWAYLIKG